jgi:hypothetical protein
MHVYSLVSTGFCRVSPKKHNFVYIYVCMHLCMHTHKDRSLFHTQTRARIKTQAQNACSTPHAHIVSLAKHAHAHKHKLRTRALLLTRMLLLLRNRRASRARSAACARSQRWDSAGQACKIRANRAEARSVRTKIPLTTRAEVGFSGTGLQNSRQQSRGSQRKDEDSFDY